MFRVPPLMCRVVTYDHWIVKRPRGAGEETPSAAVLRLSLEDRNGGSTFREFGPK